MRAYWIITFAKAGIYIVLAEKPSEAIGLLSDQYPATKELSIASIIKAEALVTDD